MVKSKLNSSAYGKFGSVSGHTTQKMWQIHQGKTLLVYVDDIMITSSSNDEIARLKTLLKNEFKVKDFETSKYIFGIEIAPKFTKIAIF